VPRLVPNVLTLLTPKRKLLRTTQTWRAAYDSRDPQKITGQYAKDAVFWGTSSKTVSATPETIMEYFAEAKKRPDARVEIIEQHIQIYGDIAINTGLYNFSDIGMASGCRILPDSAWCSSSAATVGCWCNIILHGCRSS
jgi:hypothetical protein